MNPGQTKLEVIPVYDPQSNYRKTNSKLIGKVIIKCYDDGNPPIIQFFGPPNGTAIKRVAKDIFRRLTQSVVRKAAEDDKS